ncbi:MAG: urease accessory protein UreD [Gammaproteobacteria bacterium]
MPEALAAGHAPANHAAGWHARLALGFDRADGRVRLARRAHSGPLAVQRPFHPEGPDVCHVYLLHPPAGIVGGDRLDIDAQVDPGAHVLLTTPAATRFYRSAGAEAQLLQNVRVAAGATLEWLPQETILFDGAIARLCTRIDCEPGARILAWEIACLGRPAAGEQFARGHADMCMEFHRDGRPLLLERLAFAAGSPVQAARAGLMRMPVTATLCLAPADAQAAAQASALLARAQGCIAGATLIGDLLVVRVLAHDGAAARAAFERLWHALRPGFAGRPACAPRIWST